MIIFKNLIGIIGLILIMTLTGCNNGTGTNEGIQADSGNRIYFIKMAPLTEAHGTLCFIYENSRTVYTVTNRNMTGFSVNEDKTKIVFAEVLSGYSGTFLATINIDGSSYQQNYISGSNPSFGNGDLIYFDDQGTLFSINMDFTGKKQIDVPVEGTKRFPRLSPDGELLAFYQTSPGSRWYSDDIVFLYTYNLKTGSVSKLNDASIPVSYHNWSPDGSLIAFSTTTGITPPLYETWVVKADGSEQPVKITDAWHPSSGACGFPVYIDDNDFLLVGSTKQKELNYYSSWDGNHYKYELAKLKSDGTAVTILLPGISIRNPVFVKR